MQILKTDLFSVKLLTVNFQFLKIIPTSNGKTPGSFKIRFYGTQEKHCFEHSVVTCFREEAKR